MITWVGWIKSWWAFCSCISFNKHWKWKKVIKPISRKKKTMMVPTENDKVFKSFTNHIYCFAIDEKQLPLVKNVPMLQSSFFFSIFLLIRKSRVKLSCILLSWKKIYEIDFFQVFGHRMHQDQSKQTEHLWRAQIPSSINRMCSIAFGVNKKKIKKSPLIKPWNRNDWKSWKGYICTVSSIVDKKCINVFISPKNVYSVDHSEAWWCQWAVWQFPL